MTSTLYYIIGGVLFVLLLMKMGVFGVTVNTKDGPLTTFSKTNPEDDDCNCGKDKPKAND
jgi:hypothetical protein